MGGGGLEWGGGMKGGVLKRSITNITKLTKLFVSQNVTYITWMCY